MKWSEIDWDSLARHRERFLGSGAPDGPYWASAALLPVGRSRRFDVRLVWDWCVDCSIDNPDV